MSAATPAPVSGREIYFRETECAGAGRERCALIGRDAASWGDELEALRADYQGATLEREVEHIRDAVHRELQELERRERQVARRERELNLLRERVARFAASKHFIARSAAMEEVLELAAQVAPLDTTVLVYGESGTGKEFIVRLIHDQSPRASQPFVSINCAALTETLLESELFGHVRGAFTGAVRDKAGLFEVAGSGTLFLDEIGEVAPTVQAKLLRALQEREIRRVGAERNIRIHARVDRRDQSRSQGRGARGHVPRGPLLPARGLRHHGAAPARTPRRHPGARSRVRAARGGTGQEGRHGHLPGRDDGADDLPMAGQRARARARDRAGRDRRERHEHQGPRAAAEVSQPSRPDQRTTAWTCERRNGR